MKPNGLLHGGRHGLLTIPKEIARQIPAAAARLQPAKQGVIEYCRSKDYSLEGLQRITKDVS